MAMAGRVSSSGQALRPLRVVFISGSTPVCSVLASRKSTAQTKYVQKPRSPQPGLPNPGLGRTTSCPWSTLESFYAGENLPPGKRSLHPGEGQASGRQADDMGLLSSRLLQRPEPDHIPRFYRDRGTSKQPIQHQTRKTSL